MKITNRILYWAPRIICILAILFISMFAADAFGPGLTIMEQLGGFIIHLIPSFVLLALLIVAWKREFIGGVIFTAIGIGLSPFIYNHNYNMNHSVGMSLGILLVVTFPIIVVGILFILNHFIKEAGYKNRNRKA